jgi:hypothetical protein
MAPWHAILRATPFAPSNPCAARPQTRHVPRRFQHALVEVELRLFGSDRPGRGCTGGSKARPGFLLPGRAFVCPDAPEGLVGTMGVSSSALVS